MGHLTQQKQRCQSLFVSVNIDNDKHRRLNTDIQAVLLAFAKVNYLLRSRIVRGKTIQNIT